MVAIPSASTTVRDQAGAAATGLDVVCLFTPCAVNADCLPRLFGSAAAVYAQHGYCEGVEYAALHADATRKPFLVCGLPIATAGAISQVDMTGNTGTCIASVAALANGVLAEHEGILVVDHPVGTTVTIGTDQVKLAISLDGGRTYKPVRLGTANSYTPPYFNVQLTFTAGTLKGGEMVLTWFGSAPRSDAAGWALARQKLAAQQKGFRSIVLCGDVQNSTEALDYNTQLVTYETANQRFVYGRASVKDRMPLGKMSRTRVRMQGAPSLTFAEVGVSGDTITRATGSWITDGFAVGDKIVITGATASAGANNISAIIAGLTATVITLGSEDLVAEVTTGCTIYGYTQLTFAEVGVTGDTITRSKGSWIEDGFAVGDTIAISGSTDPGNIHTNATIQALSATVMTLSTADLAADGAQTYFVSIMGTKSKAAWMAATDAAFEAVDDKPRLDLSAGRGRVRSPFTGWLARRPSGWAASLREYQHDLHVATWRKSDGPTDFDLFDEDGNLVEWDDRADGGAASAARFTSLRTWPNGPNGAFVTMSLTRASEGSLLGQTHNEAVVNLVCTTVQLNTEDAAIGVSLILEADGKATADSLAKIKKQVDNALHQAVLVNKLGEGPRASLCSWTPDADVLFNVPTPIMTGVCALLLNGTVHSVQTSVLVQTGA
jgi:hypothetical protein